MKKIVAILIFGLNVCSPSYGASEQVFRINNTLAQMDVEGEVDKYIAVLDRLTEDMKNDGIFFSYNGTKVSGENFCINVNIYIKKEIFEKYRKYGGLTTQSKTIWGEAENKYQKLHKYKNWFITGLLPGFFATNPRLDFKLELLDVNKKRIFNDQNFSQGVNGIQTYRSFFEYINMIEGSNKNFNNLLIYSQKDRCYNLPLAEIQKIDAIKFSVIDLYKEGMD